MSSIRATRIAMKAMVPRAQLRVTFNGFNGRSLAWLTIALGNILRPRARHLTATAW